MLTEPLSLTWTLLGTVRVTDWPEMETAFTVAPFKDTLLVDMEAGTVVPAGKVSVTVETPGLKRPWAPTLKVTA